MRTWLAVGSVEEGGMSQHFGTLWKLEEDCNLCDTSAQLYSCTAILPSERLPNDMHVDLVVLGVTRVQ